MTLFCYNPSCFSCAIRGILTLSSPNMIIYICKNKKVCNKTRSLLVKGQGTEHRAVKLPIKATTTATGAKMSL